MPVISVLIGICILLFLIMKFKMNTFVALIIVSFVVAMILGIEPKSIVGLIEKGIGDQLGFLALVFGLGSMLGRLVADAGGGYRIAITLINKFGRKNIQAAVVVTSFIVGIALFFEVGVVLLIPIIYAIARELKISFLYLCIPMAAALNVTHAFLPPHPAPTAISVALGANIGQVLLLGFLVGIPTTIIAGPLFNKVLMKLYPSAYEKKGDLKSLGPIREFTLEETPGFGISVLTSLFPVILMGTATIVTLLIPGESALKDTVNFIGEPGTAMLLSVLIAVYTMGYARKIPMADVGESLTQSISQIAMMLLIIGGGGALKQILVTGNVGEYVASIFTATNMSPLLIAWIIAALLKVCVGSSTVSALTTAGLAAPLMAGGAADPAMMVLSIGAGSVMACHVNDGAFWLIKEYFGLTLKETFIAWTTLTTIISVAGIACIMAVNMLF